MVALGPERDKLLGLDEERLKLRMDANEGIDQALAKLAMYISEGHGMAYGYNIESGLQYSYMLADALRFSLAALMEQGYLSKRLPKKAQPKPKEKDDGEAGQDTMVEPGANSTKSAEGGGAYL